MWLKNGYSTGSRGGEQKVNVAWYLHSNGEGNGKEEGSGEAQVSLFMVKLPVQKLWALSHLGLGHRSPERYESLAGPGRAEARVTEVKSDKPNPCP